MARILAQMGVRAVDESGRDVVLTSRPQAQTAYLWPSCVWMWELWMGLQTQWRVGMAGSTGLDYAACLAVIDRVVPKRQRSEAFEAVRACERVTLKAWADKRAAEEAQRV